MRIDAAAWLLLSAAGLLALSAVWVLHLALVPLHAWLALILHLAWPVVFLPVAVWIVNTRVIAAEERKLVRRWI